MTVAMIGVVAGISAERGESDFPYPVPLGLNKPPVPMDNPITEEKVALGKLLFFDKRLSRDLSTSCSTCHDPQKGWTDRRPTPIGVRSQIGERNAPTVLNAAYQRAQFWDGRAEGLEAQAKIPIQDPREMDLALDEAAARIAGVAGYAPFFKAAYGDSQVTIDRIVGAVASFERTILSGDSPYDRYKAGRMFAMSRSAARGMKLFAGKARCASCHLGENFTDEGFHNLGVGLERRVEDPGRYKVTQQDKDRGAFRTPTLRNLEGSFPYMHDGSQASLGEVIDFLDQGGRANSRLDPQMKPLGLTPKEKKDLLAFLGALNGSKALVDEPKELPK